MASLLEQAYTDWELLLIDDGSIDGSGDVCDSFAAQDPRIRVFHQPNKGVAAARCSASAKPVSKAKTPSARCKPFCNR